MSDDGKCTCPQARRTKTRRCKKSKIYPSKSWKEKSAAFIAGKKCEWCGSTEKLLVHHPYRDTPDAIYEDLYLSGCIVLCNTCHFMFHRRHKKKCPICHENWMDLDVDRCFSCHLKENPGLAEKIQEQAERKEQNRKKQNDDRNAKNRAAKAKHPCTFHRIGGRCGRSPIGSRCRYAPTKAAKMCIEGFKAKKGMK